MTLLDIMWRRRTEKFLDEATELTDDWQGTKTRGIYEEIRGLCWPDLVVNGQRV